MPLNRRRWLQNAGRWLATAGVLAGLPPGAQAAPLEETLLEELQACTPPGDPLAALLAGNRRFARAWRAVSGLHDVHQRSLLLARFWSDNCQVDPVALTRGQKPWLALLTCSDSRVAANLTFAQGSGEIFEVACAGNTAFAEAIASLEYAVSEIGIRQILVLGHSGCGAVTAAMDDAPLTPLLEELVRPIRAGLVSRDDLSAAVQGNARLAAGQLAARSALLREAEAAGRLSIRSAYLDIGSGLVTLL